MHQRLAEALLNDIYHPVSAAVSIGEKGEILGVHLFDTEYGGECMRVEPDARELWLMSSHADGCKTLYDADLQNLRRMRQGALCPPASVQMRSYLDGLSTYKTRGKNVAPAILRQVLAKGLPAAAFLDGFFLNI